MPLLETLALSSRDAALATLMLCACWHDVRARRIPNWLVVCGLAGALALGPVTVPHALAGAALGAGLLLPLYAGRGCGAGDVKLLAVAGAFAGVPDALFVVVATFVSGGLLAAGSIAFQRRARAALGNLRMLAWTGVARLSGVPAPAASTCGVRLPYSIAIAAGTAAWLAALRV